MTQRESDPARQFYSTRYTRTTNRILGEARDAFDRLGWHGMRPDRVAVLAEVSSSTLRNRYTTKRDLAGAAYAAKLHEVNDTATYYRRDEAYRSEALLGEFVHALSHLFADTPALAIALLDTSHQKPSAICTRLFNETVGVFGLLIEDACPTHYPEFLVAQYHLNALLAMSTSDTSVNPDTLAEITLSQLM